MGVWGAEINPPPEEKTAEPLRSFLPGAPFGGRGTTPSSSRSAGAVGEASFAPLSGEANPADSTARRGSPGFASAAPRPVREVAAGPSQPGEALSVRSPRFLTLPHQRRSLRLCARCHPAPGLKAVRRELASLSSRERPFVPPFFRKGFPPRPPGEGFPLALRGRTPSSRPCSPVPGTEYLPA